MKAPHLREQAGAVADYEGVDMAESTERVAAAWKPVVGPTVEEHGENYAASYPALYECPVCAAAVPRGNLDKHDEWHATLRLSTGPLGLFTGGRL